MTLVVMLFTTASAWAFKTQAVTYLVSRNGSTITISGGGESHSCNANASSSMGISYTWEANVSCGLANGMTIKPSASVNVIGTPITTASTTFTFTTNGTTAITGVTFKGVNGNVGSSTSSEPVTTFSITIPANTTFTSFEVTFGYISGSCGSSATWSLAKQNGQYTALTIGGSGAMNNYSGSDTPWGTDLTLVTIGNNVTSIGNNAFNGCTALTRVNVQKTDGLVTLGSDVFTGCNALQHIVVPTLALAVQYRQTSNWSAHAEKMSTDFGGYLFHADGTTTDAAYAIVSADDLNHLAAAVNAGNNASGLTFRQTTDITYTGGSDTESNYTAIGKNNCSFNGTFDGQNHVIRGIRIYKGGTSSADIYQGLFGHIEGSGATVKNVILADARITGYDRTGGIAGYNYGIVENCHVLSNVTIHAVQSSTYEHGGIAGRNYATVTSCTSAAAITAADGLTACAEYGGIVGKNYSGTVKDCIYLGTTLGGRKYVGAIVGRNDSSVSDCYFTDANICGKDNVGFTLAHDRSAVGNTSGTITNCGPALQDAADNSGFLSLMAARNAALTAVSHTPALSTAADITLQGRTLYKDGAWNTLVLPFAVSTTSGPLAGDNMVAMTLNKETSGLSGTTLTLNFDNAPATIPAGTPFIIKWASGDNINNPVFTGVTIENNASTEVTFTGGSFKGTYSPIEWTTENKSILFLGANDYLYWPQPSGGQNPYLNAFRAYFDLGTYEAREFVLNFGEDNEVTGIVEAEANSTLYTLNSKLSEWYTLNGVKLEGKPTQAGLYIVNGRKVVVK